VTVNAQGQPQAVPNLASAGGAIVAVALPRYFSLDTMQGFIEAAMKASQIADVSGIAFDLTVLASIEPEGVAALANAIEYFRLQGKAVFLKGLNPLSKATAYLSEAGFLQRYLGRTVACAVKSDAQTIPLELFKAKEYVPYLYTRLMPWLASELRTGNDSLETIRVCLEEIFHNVDFHAKIDTGCTFSEHFPKIARTCIAISDWGVGIPYNVRRVQAVQDDAEALRIAAREGFTTGTGPRNRGAGLPNLIKYVAQRNAGEVRIYSGYGMLIATRGTAQPDIHSTALKWCYPGTIVHVVLRTDTLDRVESDVKPEEFRW
jgi:anti-anti-sigma regulatory factor/anti-sigma regulatory factor (Ser/Thr protein kinase)